MSVPLPPGVFSWLSEPLSTQVSEAIRRLAAADDVQHVAIMPDVHLSNDVCIGTVLATTRLVYPAAVGSDIGCGIAALRFKADADVLGDECAAGRLLAGLYRRVPVNRQNAANAPAALPAELEDWPLSDARLEKLKRRDGRVQTGTLGRGNHFLEFQSDPQDQLWVMIHSGSRGIGQAISAHHTARATASSHGLPLLDAQTHAGQDYLNDVAWALKYAAHNRLSMLAAVTALLDELFAVQADWDSLIHAHHNHVQREVHFGEPCWVHRKGAQPAGSGEAGIIPGSMGTASFHVVGRGCEQALCSSSHGAGRKLSRVEARGAVSGRQFRRQMEGVWFDVGRAEALREEAPAAYKDVHAVMRAQRELTCIVRKLTPILCYKGV